MSGEKIENSLTNLSNALSRLGEALQESDSSNDLAVDGTIQRFEFTVELFWKTLKRLLAEKGIETTSPKDALRQAYANKWFDDEVLWLSMLKDRNETSHVYDKDKAIAIYNNIRRYHPEMKRFFEFLKNNYKTL